MNKRSIEQLEQAMQQVFSDRGAPLPHLEGEVGFSCRLPEADYERRDGNGGVCNVLRSCLLQS